MTYLERDEDVLRYQGQAFSYIGVDELTQYVQLILTCLYFFGRQAIPAAPATNG